MTRTLITATALTLIAITAPSASAATISNPNLSQEMEHGVAPTMEADSGFGTAATAEPTDTAPEGSAEEGVSTSPGIRPDVEDVAQASVEPVVATEPTVPAPAEPTQAEDEKDQSVDPEVCGDYADQIDQLRGQAGFVFAISDAFGGWGTELGSSIRQEAYELESQAQQAEDQAAKEGCYGGGPAPE